MTEVLLDGLRAGAADRIVQLWPEPGTTAERLLEVRPTSFRGITASEDAARRLDGRLRNHPGLVDLLTGARTDGEYVSFAEGQPGAIDLPDESATAIVGECLLSPLDRAGKLAVIAEAARLLPPGGRLTLHEFCLSPRRSWDDGADAHEAGRMADALAGRCGGLSPLTADGWRAVITEGGLVPTGLRVGDAEPPRLRTVVREHGPRIVLQMLRRLPRARAAVGAQRALAELIGTRPDALGAVVIIAERPLIDDLLLPDV